MTLDTGTKDNTKAECTVYRLASCHIYLRKGFLRVVPKLSLLFARETLDKFLSTLALIWPTVNHSY